MIYIGRVAILLSPHWLGPIVVWLTQKAGARPVFEPFTLERHVVPEDVAASFQRSCDALATEGFHPFVLTGMGFDWVDGGRTGARPRGVATAVLLVGLDESSRGDLMEGLAVVGAVFVLLVVGYLGVSAVLRRIPARSLRLPTGPIPEPWHGIVERNVRLALGLTSDERERLLRLVQVFLAEKHFEGCDGLTLTEEMKVTIAAEACLLLLHLDGLCYPTLRTVLVYPHGFVPKRARSLRTGEIAPAPARLMGESWGAGVVVISWDDAVRGARNPADGENVVLHEFAHQLDGEDGATDGTPILSPSALRTWGGVLSAEYERLRQDAAHDRPSALDSYGATNRAEFFAVATETFFEKPDQLEREHPELYGQLQQFYQQDPARRAPPPPAAP